MEINDVLVPTDFSACSLRALDFARSLLSPGGAPRSEGGKLKRVVDKRKL